MAGRDDALAQPVRIKDSSIETPGGLENISNSSGELAGEPSPYRNWERPLVLAFANLPRKQWTDDLFQESFRLTASHLEGRVDPAHQLHNPMIQERDAGLEAHGHAHAVFHGEELRQVDPQIVIEAFVENLVRGRLVEGSHVALARGVASQSAHEPGVQQRMARRLHATVGRNPSVLEGAGLTTEPVIELAGWPYWRVAPLGEDWVEVDWFRLVKRLLKKHVIADK